MVARVASLLCILALLAPSAALAQGGGAFQPIPQAPPQQPTTVAPDRSNPNDDGLSSTQQLLIVLSALLVMGVIAWAIMRDARNAAPAETRGAPVAAGDAPQPRGSRRPASVRHRDNRAKAKAARQARKKARKR
jgi:hypothetical protein